MRKIKLVLLILIPLVLTSQINAQKKLGIALTGGYDISVAGLGNWYFGAGLVGGKIIFSSSENSEIEIEYNYSNFSNSSIANRMFSYRSQVKYGYENKNSDDDPIFLVDGKGKYIPFDEVDKTVHPNVQGAYADSLYFSNGKANMTVHSITINSVSYFDRMNFLDSRFFITCGAGLYIYNHQVDSLLFAGKPIRGGKKVNMEPFEDSRVALGFNFGGGLDMFIADGFSLDIRAKYNFLIGELRPLEAYNYEGKGFTKDGKNVGGYKKVFPIQYITLSASIKYYFQ